MQYYMITIRKHQVKDYVEQRDIREILIYLHDNQIDVDDGICECHGKYKQLHFHGISLLPKQFYYKPFTKCAGFRIHFKPFKPNALYAIKQYIYKHNPTYDYHIQTLMCNYYRHHFGFKRPDGGTISNSEAH